MGKGEDVLIVDDMEDQRILLSTILENLCYKVSTVSSGEDAVEYIKTNSTDIIILDMIMETGIDVLDTYKQIIEIKPNQRAIIASGYAESDRVKKAQDLGEGTYVQKPYTIKNIGTAVRNELDK
jgi:DNA-binding NtrC family response regulator